MADSYIPVKQSTDQSVANVDTRTQPGGDHREVVNIGDPVTSDIAPVDLENGMSVTVEKNNQGQKVDIDSVSIAFRTDTVLVGGTEVQPKTAIKNIAASTTDSSIVAAVSTKKIRVLSAIVLAGGTATDFTFNSKPSGAGAAISPLFALGINIPLNLPFNPLGHFDTNAGEGLTATTGAGATVGVLIKYIEIPS